MKKFLHIQLDAILKVLEKGQDDFTEDDYHTLRVAIKKFRAVFALLRFKDERARPPKCMKALNAVFKKAGKVRELQVEKKLLAKYKVAHKAEYFIELEEKIEKAQKKFFRILHKKSLHKHVSDAGKELMNSLSGLHTADIRKYTERKGKKLRKHFKKCGNDESRLHRVRKKLKIYYYISGIERNNTKSNSLDTLQDALGKWHDLKTAISHLAASISFGNLAPDEVSRLIKLMAQLSVQKEIILEDVRKAMKEVKLTGGPSS